MSRRTITETQRRWLAAESDWWRQEELLSPEQVRGILDRYEDARDIGRRRQSMLSFAVLSLAAVLFGMGVFLLIGFNWDALPRWSKLAAVLTAVGGVQAAALTVRDRLGRPLAAEALFLLGCLLYGAGIWLVAQAYHLDGHYPDGVWWWAVGTLPFALCLNSVTCHMLLAALLALWAGMEVFNFAHAGPWLFGRWRLPNAAATLPLLVLPGVVWAYRRAAPTTLGLYIALLTWWLVLQAFAVGLETAAVFWMGGVGAALMVVAAAHRPGDALAATYRLWGTLLTAGVLLVLGSVWFWEDGVRRTRVDSVAWATTAVFGGLVLLIGVAAGAVATVRRRLGPATASRDWLRPLAVPLGLLLGTFVFVGCWLTGMVLPGLWPIPVVLANGLMLGLALHLMGVGAREERVRPFAAGVLYVLVWAIARYVDLFGAAGGMVGAAVLFFLCAAGLVYLARFWSRTRSHRGGHERPEPVPLAGPAWLDSATDWIGGHVRPLLVAAAAGQLAVLVGMIAVESAPLLVGQTIRLRVRPVDPRDLFRGDYVILDYDLNDMAAGALQGSRDELAGRSVYVTLEPEAGGPYWCPVAAGLQPPEEGAYIRGRYDGGPRQPVKFGIEAYFVQEGAGLEWERRMRRMPAVMPEDGAGEPAAVPAPRPSSGVSAEIALAPWGQAKLKRLIPGG